MGAWLVWRALPSPLPSSYIVNTIELLVSLDIGFWSPRSYLDLPLPFTACCLCETGILFTVVYPFRFNSIAFSLRELLLINCKIWYFANIMYGCMLEHVFTGAVTTLT